MVFTQSLLHSRVSEATVRPFMSTTSIFTLPFTPPTLMVVELVAGLGKRMQVTPSAEVMPCVPVVKVVTGVQPL